MLGIGGLGHLGVQFAVKMGFKTVAIARGTDKELLARTLGAWRYLDSQAQSSAEELITLGRGHSDSRDLDERRGVRRDPGRPGHRRQDDHPSGCFA